MTTRRSCATCVGFLLSTNFCSWSTNVLTTIQRFTIVHAANTRRRRNVHTIVNYPSLCNCWTLIYFITLLIDLFKAHLLSFHQIRDGPQKEQVIQCEFCGYSANHRDQLKVRDVNHTIKRRHVKLKTDSLQRDFLFRGTLRRSTCTKSTVVSSAARCLTRSIY